MKQYIPKFEEKDRRIKSAAARETMERRQQQIAVFKKWREDQARHVDEEGRERQKLRKFSIRKFSKLFHTKDQCVSLEVVWV